MRSIFAKFPLLSKIQTVSHKVLVIQSSNHHHLQSACPLKLNAGILGDLEQFFLVKNNFVCVL